MNVELLQHEMLLSQVWQLVLPTVAITGRDPQPRFLSPKCCFMSSDTAWVLKQSAILPSQDKAIHLF